jgi:hypothetical protein
LRTSLQPRQGSSRSPIVRRFFLFFAIFYVISFVDLHFLAFFPLTIRDPLSVGMSALVALLVGLCAGAYAVSSAE